MSKKLITNVRSMINRSATSKVLLYDAKKNGLLESINGSISLIDDINNYDAIMIEVIMHDPVQKQYHISDFTIFSKYVYNQEPITDSLNDFNNIYMHTIVGGSSVGTSYNEARIGLQFTSTTSIKLISTRDSGSFVSKIRNVYGINFGGGTTLYSPDEPIEVGKWFDNKTVYRSIVNYDTIPFKVGIITLPHNIPNIETIVSYKVYVSIVGDPTCFELPFGGDGSVDTHARMDLNNVMITNNDASWGNSAMRGHLIVDYTKK